MTNILAVAVDTMLLDRISVIPGHVVVSIGRTNVASVRERMRNQTFLPDVILIGDELLHEKALRYARAVHDAHPQITIVLVRTPDRRLRKEAARAGISHVVPASITDDQLAALCGSPASSANQDDTPPIPSEPQRHQVIVVASPKGGVGKTTAAVNLAAVLAESAPGQVVLLDLDLQFGDVATVLDLSPEYTVADALHSGAADSMLLRTLLVSHPAQFSVLCGANHPAEIGPIHGDQIRKLVSQFSSNFQYVVVDTSAGLQEETLSSLEEATDVIFVATLDVATLRDVRKEVDVLAELNLLPSRNHLVLNRVDRLSGLTTRDAEAIVGLTVDTVVPASPQVSLASNHATLVVRHKKAKGVRRPIEQFVEMVSGESHRTRQVRRSS